MRFRIALLAIALLFVAVGCSGLPKDNPEATVMVPVAAIKPDQKTAQHVNGVLRDRGIDCRVEGFGMYSICVPREDRERAVWALKDDAWPKKYWIRFPQM